MAPVYIHGNDFYDNSHMFEQYNEYSFIWSGLERDTAVLKAKLGEGDVLKPAVAELETAIKSKQKRNIGQTVAKYAAQFSTSTFANLASAGILALVKMFLP